MFQELPDNKQKEVRQKLNRAIVRLSKPGSQSNTQLLWKLSDKIHSKPKINDDNIVIKKLLNKYEKSNKHDKVRGLLSRNPELRNYKPFELKQNGDGSWALNDKYAVMPNNDDTYHITKDGKKIGSSHAISTYGKKISNMFPPSEVTGKNLAPNIYKILNYLHKGIESDQSVTLRPAVRLWDKLVQQGLADKMTDKSGNPILNSSGDQRYKMFHHNTKPLIDKLKNIQSKQQ